MKSFLRLGLLVVALSVALASVQGVAAKGGGWEILGQHTVRAGETVYCIARAYGVDPWAISTQNALHNPGRIHAGLVFNIPNVPATLPAGPVCARQFGTAVTQAIETTATSATSACGACTCRSTHIVTWGNTLSWIAIHYGADMWSIAECNCIYDLNRIQVGQSLCIP
jgi:LysM repeat protein